MYDFESERKMYLKRLERNTGLLDKLLEDNDLDSLKFARVLLRPKNAKELTVADCTVKLEEDTDRLKKAAETNSIEKVSIEESAGIKAFMKVLKCLYNDEEIDKERVIRILSDNESGEVSLRDYAKKLFEIYAFFTGDIEECLDYISKVLNISKDSIIDLYLVRLLINQALAIIFESQPNKKRYDVDSLTDKDVEELVEFTDEFHNLCEKNIKEDELDSLINHKFLELLQRAEKANKSRRF